MQLDLNMPSRFKLTYTDKDGTKQTPVMIHRALIGSPDRFMGILMEHYAGAFPAWLSPVQVRVLPISEKHVTYAREVLATLTKNSVRADVDDANESLGKKIRGTKKEKIPYVLVVGDQEISDKTLSVESRDKGKLGTMNVEDFVEKITEEIKTRA